jgi:hypothetical protein
LRWKSGFHTLGLYVHNDVMQAFGTPEFEISLSPASVNDCMWPTDRMWDRCSHAGMCWFITRLHSVLQQVALIYIGTRTDYLERILTIQV